MTVLLGFAGSLFLVAGVAKWLDISGFAGYLSQLHPSFRSAAVPLAVAASGLECTIGVLLLVSGWIPPLASLVALIATAMSVAFIAVQVNGWRNAKSSCRCFGKFDTVTPTSLSMIRALLLCAATAATLALSLGPNAGLLSLDVPGIVLGVMLGLTVVVLTSVLSELDRFRRYKQESREVLANLAHTTALGEGE